MPGLQDRGMVLIFEVEHQVPSRCIFILDALSSRILEVETYCWLRRAIFGWGRLAQVGDLGESAGTVCRDESRCSASGPRLPGGDSAVL